MGVAIAGGPGVVVNNGRIIGYGVARYLVGSGSMASATVGSGVMLSAGGTVENGFAAGSAPSIQGGVAGVRIAGGPGTVENYGTISGATAVVFGAGMAFAELLTAGTITGSGGNAVSFASGNDTVVVQPGAVFSGSVVASASGANTLVLGLDAAVQSFSGLGSQFQNFASIAAPAGALWDMVGANAATGALAVTLGNGSSLTVSGSLLVSSTLSQLTLGGGGTFGVDAAARCRSAPAMPDQRAPSPSRPAA